MGRLSGLFLGQILVSSIKERDGIETIACTSLSKQYSDNTILENAINFHYDDPQTDKKRQLSVQQVLTMLNDLQIELTPTEKLEMLRWEKEYLQAELARVDGLLKQQVSQQK